jgi:exopolysaccharide production protein ExoQ
MNPSLNLIEKGFTIFAWVFLTGILSWSSLFVSPDPKAIAGNEFNPFESVLSLVQYAIYAIAFFLLVVRWRTSIWVLLNNASIWILPIMALISFLWSDFPDWSIRKAIATVQTSYLGWYVASRFSLKQQLQLLGWALGIVLILSVLFTISFPAAAIEAGTNVGAWRGPFAQKNLFARLLVLTSLVFLLLGLASLRHRWVYGLGLILAICLIVLASSKTALLLLIMFAILLPLYQALRWRGTVMVPLFITAMLIGSSIATAMIGNWENLLLAFGRDATLSGRVGLWESAIAKILERPWLGYGYQGFWRETGEATVIWALEGYKPPHAHNGFINLALDFGLLGLAIFLGAIALNYLRAIHWLRLGRTSIELFPICYITFFFMYNHSENTIIEQNSLFWTLLVAIALSMHRTYPSAINGMERK